MNRARLAIYALPPLTVLVVAFALLVVGSARTHRAALVLGGPADQVQSLSFQIRVRDEHRSLQVAVPKVKLEAKLFGKGRPLGTWQGTGDASGIADAAFELKEPSTSPVVLEVAEASGLVLAQGRITLTRNEWRAEPGRGGPLQGNTGGELTIVAVPAEGIFAVPFTHALLVSIRARDGSAVRGAKVTISGDGFNVAGEKTRTTDDRGKTRYDLTPLEFSTNLKLDARDAEGQRQGSFFGSLPVVPGAQRAQLKNGRLLIHSPIPRERSYFAVVSARSRVRGGSVLLHPDGRGGARGSLPLDKLPEGELWAVVSSEADLASPAAVGWPLRPQKYSRRTVKVRDHLLIDGFRTLRVADERRTTRARWLAAGFALFAGWLAVLLLGLETARARRRLADHLEKVGDAELSANVAQTGQTWRAILIGGVCVGMGFVLVALLLMARGP